MNQKKVYIEKLKSLTSVGNQILFRQSEHAKRDPIKVALLATIEQCKTWANTTDEKYAHIDEENRAKIRTECDTASEWVYSQYEKQAELPLYSDPVITSTAMEERKAQIERNCKYIMNKPKPIVKEPKKENKPESEEDSKNEGQENAKQEQADEKETPSTDGQPSEDKTVDDPFSSDGSTSSSSSSSSNESHNAEPSKEDVPATKTDQEGVTTDKENSQTTNNTNPVPMDLD